MLNDWNDGCQGRNRTADASLFRAVVFHSYLADSVALNVIFDTLKARFIGTLLERPPVG
jgi:hypothetical protein